MRSTACAPPSAGRPTTSTRPGCRPRVGASSLTLGGLLKHLAFVEDYVFTTKLTGAPWDVSAWDGENWPFTSAADDTPEQLYALWEDAVERSRTSSTRPWPTGVSTSSSTSPRPTVAMRACAGSSAT